MPMFNMNRLKQFPGCCVFLLHFLIDIWMFDSLNMGVGLPIIAPHSQIKHSIRDLTICLFEMLSVSGLFICVAFVLYNVFVL